tara:strand:- start:106871 stop:109048 length:2178 start_codon:yes stop_codon:yes gene_type:complete
MKNLILILIFLIPNIAISQKDDFVDDSKKLNFNLDEIWKEYKFSPNSLSSFKSMKDGEHYSLLEKKTDKQEINKHRFSNGEKIRTIWSDLDFKISKINNYNFSENENFILLKTQREKIYRRSSKYICYLYNIKRNKLSLIDEKKIMHAQISPDEKNIAYVFDNNLFIYNINNKISKQITFDGEKNKIINGASDWVYEEEFKLVRGFKWSNDGKNLAYYKFDETQVKEFSMDIYDNKLYPSQQKFKYPKAGEKNSTVKIYYYNLYTQMHNFIYTEKDYEYIPRIKWTNSPNLLVLYGLNRKQNELDFILANVNNNTNRILFTEKDKYYIDIHDNLTFLPNNNFIWTSEKSGFNHIYIKDFEGDEIQVTKGNWEVTEFHGVNSDKMKIFYTSTEDGSINRSLYIQDLNSNIKVKLSSRIGFNESVFSKGMKYYLNAYSNANTAPIYTLNKDDGTELMTLEDNSEFNSKIKNYNLSKKEFFTIKTKKAEMNAWMIKPPNFDATKKYPLFMFVYGGPGSQEVINSFGWAEYFWHQMLAQNGYIVACVDNRGTGGKGSEFKKVTYKQLGKLETIDQIDAANYFGELKYIDEKRIGIQGWSYGGYMSSLCITKGADIFSLAIAVAPVTNWRYYDNIYTERYMQTPEENSQGYDNNSPINHVDKLEGKYLIIHGGADDNVHIQNTMEMIKQLVKSNKQFDQFIYPDKNHSIYGENARYHLYKKMTDYILSNL